MGVINDGDLNTSEAEVKDARVEDMSFPTLGDATEAHRIKFTIKAKGESGPFSQVDGYFDFIWVQKGDIAFSIVAFDLLSPFPVSTLQETTEKALAKVTTGR